MSTSIPNLWYVQKLGLTQRLPFDTVLKLREHGKLERWGHRAKITRRPTDVVAVLSGGVELNDGLHDKLVRLKPGDLFGDIGEEVEEILRAYDDTVICRVDREAFEELVKDHLGMMATRVGMRARQQLQVPVAELLYRSPRSRIAKALELVADEVGETEDSRVVVPISLRSKHVAELTGVVPARTRKVLDSLYDDGLLELGRQGIVIPDLETIKSLAASRNE